MRINNGFAGAIAHAVRAVKGTIAAEAAMANDCLFSNPAAAGLQTQTIKPLICF